VRVRRVQVDSNPERIRRRQIRRHGWSEEEARRRVPDSARRKTTLPFLICESGSTGHRFRLFIEHKVVDDVAGGAFNAYGLSSTATLPLF
jgi:CRISPR-associated endonuclease Csy4